MQFGGGDLTPVYGPFAKRVFCGFNFIEFEPFGASV